MTRRDYQSPHIGDDESLVSRPLSAWQHIFAAQTNMPKVKPAPEDLPQEVDNDQCVDIRDFGAKINGISDDSDAIRKAIAFGVKRNSIGSVLICFPAGVTGIGSPIAVPSRVYFRGAGRDVSYVRALASMVSMFYPARSDPGGPGIVGILAGFIDMTIDGNSFSQRGIGSKLALGASSDSIFDPLWMLNLSVTNCLSIGVVMNTDQSVTGSLVADGLFVSNNITAGILITTLNVQIVNFDGSGNSGPSIAILAMSQASRIEGRSSDSVFVRITDTLGTGGAALAQGVYMNLVHSNTGFTLDVGHEVGLKRSMIHIMAVDSTRTGAVVNFADSFGSPNSKKGNFITVVEAGSATGPVVAFGSFTGNNTFNVIHHLAPDSTPPKYTGTIGDNSVFLDLLKLAENLPVAPVKDSGNFGMMMVNSQDDTEYPLWTPGGGGGTVGPQGAPGAPGAQGMQGFPGQDGEDAIDWPLPGAQGPQGIQGIQGPAGSGGGATILWDSAFYADGDSLDPYIPVSPGGGGSGAPTDARYITLGLNAVLTNEISVNAADASTIDAGVDVRWVWAEAARRDFKIENLTALGSAVYRATSDTGGVKAVIEGYVGADAQPFVQLARDGLRLGPGGAGVLDSNLIYLSALPRWQLDVPLGIGIDPGAGASVNPRLKVGTWRNLGAGASNMIQIDLSGTQTADGAARVAFSFLGTYAMSTFSLSSAFIGANYAPTLSGVAGAGILASFSAIRGGGLGGTPNNIPISDMVQAATVAAAWKADQHAGFRAKNAGAAGVVRSYSFLGEAQSGAGTQSFSIGQFGVAPSIHRPAFLFGGTSDTQTPTVGALVELDSTTAALLIMRMTGVQRDAIAATDGMFLYNSDVQSPQYRAAGVWEQPATIRHTHGDASLFMPSYDTDLDPYVPSGAGGGGAGTPGAPGAPGAAGATGPQGIPGDDGDDAPFFLVPGPQGPSVTPSNRRLHASRSTQQLITHGAFNTIIFPTVDYDPGGNYNNATGVYTVADAGYYLISSNLSISKAGGGNFLYNVPAIFKNGVEVTRGNPAFADSTNEVYSTVTDVLFLAVGDAITIRLYQTNTTVTSENTQALATANFVTIQRLDVPAPVSAGGSGTAIVDFGAFPGVMDASVAVTGQAGIVAGSKVFVQLQYAASADHTADEHLVEDLTVVAGNIVAGTGFTIYAANKGEPINSLYPKIYGKWNVAWQWL